MTSYENHPRSNDPSEVTGDPPGLGTSAGYTAFDGPNPTTASTGNFATGTPTVGFEPLPTVPYTAGTPPYNPGQPTGSDQTSTADVAKEQASSVASSAADAASQVTGVAKQQVSQVAREGGRQLRHLWGQAQTELADQAGAQQQRASSGLRSLGDQLTSMADKADQQGMVTDLARQAADRTHQFAGWLENRDPAGVLDEVRSFARRRPGMFLAVAFGTGLVAGRLARGLATDPDESSASTQSGAGYSPNPYPPNSPALGHSAPDPLALGTAYGTGYGPGYGTGDPMGRSDATIAPESSRGITQAGWTDVSAGLGGDQR